MEPTEDPLLHGYLIDPETRSIRPWSGRSLTDFQEAVQGYIEAVYLGTPTPHMLYVNDEFLLNMPEHFFLVERWAPSIILAGRAVLVGYDPASGEECDCTLSMEAIQRELLFVSAAELSSRLA